MQGPTELNPPVDLTSEAKTQKTYRCDLWRGGFEGVLSSGAQTFCLFIAIRYFNAGENTKALIAAAPFMGMFLSMVLLHYASLTNWRKSTWGALPSLVSGVCLILAAWTESLTQFACMVIAGYICRSSLLPFVTDIYGDNYPPDKRAAYFSKPLLLSVGVAALSGLIGSWFLESDIKNCHWTFTFLGFCAIAKALAIYSMPSKMVESTPHTHPFGNMKYVWLDKSFGYVLLTWFIMGFANLWTLPLRVDYITAPEWGIEGSAIFVAMIITVIPETLRMLLIPYWASLFDRMNFVVLRMILNLLFGLGVLLFFVTSNPWVIGLGAALIGAAFAGGSIAWNLWVTKYAPPGKTGAYMSVHVSLTGIRGTIGPILGYWTVNQIGAQNIGILSCAMMFFA
ncbi:MAG: MFS transporter, partial [Nitrospinaceae bacterium]|nr:MFS transporter [Nitrospinaceae bacterium]